MMKRILKKCLLLALPLLVGCGVVWQLHLTGISMTESDAKIKATIYTDASYGELAQDGTDITVAGALPDDVEVRAYPVEVELDGCRVLAAYDISLYRPVPTDPVPAETVDAANTEAPGAEAAAPVNDTAAAQAAATETEATEPAAESVPAADGAETAPTEYERYEPTAPVTVNIRVPGADLQNGDCSVNYIPDSGVPEQMPSAAAEDGVSFETDHFSVYALTEPMMMSAAVTVNDFNTLSSTIQKGGTQVIQLSADISAPIAISTITIPANSNITVDLNGHTITFPSYNALFQLNSSTSTLTIKDSKQGTETTQTVSSGSKYGNAATATNSSGKITLNYYVTETAVTNSATGATAETLVKHTVSTAGAIIRPWGYTVPIVSVTNGTFNMTSGMLYGGRVSAVAQTGGTVNLSGGYICGLNVDNAPFGAVNTTAGALNISGNAVLAANTANLDGGAVYATSGTVTVTGGVLSGNTASRSGGGMYLTSGAKAAMSGGYLTNNIANGSGWSDGGGGAFVGSGSSFTLTGGYITGNQAPGGGGLSTDVDSGAGDATAASNKGAIYISGGFVTANAANANEGGGLCVRDGYYGGITGGHITNNTSQTTDDWGGGGIFVGSHGTVSVKNLLMTANTATNYGGGLAGCTTSNLYLYVDDGGAIYGNTATGQTPNYNSAKPDDYNYCVGNTVFQTHGYQDFFACHNSWVLGEMLGGGAANWSGSKSDGSTAAEVKATTVAITIGKNEYKSATALMGLTANPSGTDIAKAQALAQVYINGNTSYAHGGGIMSNGNFILGTPTNIVNGISLALNGTKTLTKPATQTGYVFQFDVIDEKSGAAVSTATVNGSGTITFDPNLTFTTPGNYPYIIKERINPDYPEVTFDTKQYRITVNVAADGNATPVYGGYTASGLKINKIDRSVSTDGGKTWSSSTAIAVPTAVNGIITLTPSASGLAFNNIAAATTSVSVQKIWSNCTPTSSVQVQLYADGVAVGSPVVLTAASNWFYSWARLVKNNASGKAIVYTVNEIPINGYQSTVTQGTPGSGIDKHFNITNTASTPTYVLPDTGGGGTHPYLFIGLILVAGSSLVGFALKRKQRAGWRQMD